MKNFLLGYLIGTAAAFAIAIDDERTRRLASFLQRFHREA
jgi:hypothetical protein